MLVLDVHGAPEHDESPIRIDVRLRVGMPLEVVETNAVAARSDERVERAERLDGYVLKDQQAGHRSRLQIDTGSQRCSHTCAPDASGGLASKNHSRGTRCDAGDRLLP